MAMAARGYPEYCFEQHVGYGTALHLARLKEFGVSDLHRKSYKPIKLLLDLAEMKAAKDRQANHVVN